MRHVLKGIGIEEGPDLPAVLATAWGIHEQLSRGPAKRDPVSRSTLMAAAAHQSDRLLALLGECGFDFSSYNRILGIKSVAKAIRTPETFDINDQAQRALHGYHEEWPSRPLDALGLGAAIVIHADGIVSQRLREAGLNQKVARERLRETLMVQRLAILTSIRPFEEVGNFVLSFGLEELIENAAALAREIAPAAPLVTTSLLLATVFRTPDGGNALLTALANHVRDRDESARRIGEWLGWYRSASLEPGRYITVEALDVLAMAREFERAPPLQSPLARSGPAQIHTADVLAVLLTLPPDSNAQEFLRWIGVPAEELAQVLYDFIARRKDPGDDLALWRKRLRLGDVAAPAAAPRHVRPQVDIESLDGDDLLEFRRDVDSFAKLIAAEDLTPPLSIGLFGDWGSGKSFFMRRLRTRINELAGEAEQRANAGGRSAFHSRIVQIEFNAWHYVEANLWASLVEHIFRNLKFAGEGEKEAEARREQILQELDSAIAARLLAEKEVEEKQQERNAKAHELEMKQHAADGAGARLQRLQSVKPWEAVELSPANQKIVRDAMESVGMGHAVQTVAGAREVVGELAALGNRARVVWNWLWAGPRTRLALLAAILVAPLLITVTLPFVEQLGGLRWLATAIADLCALAGVAAVWLRKHGHALGDVFRKIERAQLAVDETMLAYERKRSEELERFEREKATAEARLANAKIALHEADDAVLKAEQKLAELSPDRQLSRFIADRAASDDYRKLLGVLAMVRNDFEKLSDLLTRQVKGSHGTFRIDRIVLYIDDLDRCPPHRVVEVLQAVHLLLAFKLFVVVVGVDARWVARSLETRHRSLWRTGSRRATDAEGRTLPGFGATPEDYLEKIFQVPFWIHPMDDDATRKLLRGIVKIRTSDEEKTTEEITKTVSTSAPPTVTSEAASASEAVGVPAELPAAMTVTTDVAAGATRLQIRAGDDEHTPEALQLEKVERDAMERLAPLILRSPRSVKRFANVYRLVRAGIDPQKLPAYLAGGYEQTLLLLGLICGAPSAAPELFERIRNAPAAQPLEHFLSELKPSGWLDNTAEQVEWNRAVKALTEFASPARAALTLHDLRDDIRSISRYSFRQTNT